MKPLKIFINFLARIIYNFRKTDIFTRAGSLTFTILLSFVPFTISVLTIISWLPLSDHCISKIQHHFLTNYIPPNSGEQIYQQIKVFLHHSQHLSILGFASLLVTTYLMVYAIEKQLNATWHNRNYRYFGKSLLVYTIFLFGVPIFSGLFGVLQLYTTVFFSSNMIIMLNKTGTFLISVLSFILVYKLIPKHKAKTSHTIIAAIIATIIFNLTKELFMHYLVKVFVNYHIIYGSLSFIPIFLIWIYLSCLNLFFCAGIIYALETKFNRALQHKINDYFRFFGSTSKFLYTKSHIKLNIIK